MKSPVHFHTYRVVVVVGLDISTLYFKSQESARVPEPIPKKLIRPKTVAPAQTKAQLLAKEKGFVLDGVALSNIQVLNWSFGVAI